MTTSVTKAHILWNKIPSPHICESRLMVSWLQLASIRMTECTTSFRCNGHSESFIGAPTGQLELDQLHLFNKNTNRCVCLSHNCNVALPLNFKTASDKLWQVKQIFKLFAAGWFWRLWLYHIILCFPLDKYDFCIVAGKYPEYLSFEDTNHRDLHYSVCDQIHLTLALHPAYHFLPAGSCIICTGLAAVEFPPKHLMFMIRFPLPDELIALSSIYLFPHPGN